ncbi:CoA transferase [Sphingomonas naphthae]|uniref:CoA transferase n=1 Tax=Sphingomonas naphthae TaxID=1813468 RepID=A0ABY7TTI7_9SPHN|nr:CoA transferase [Sphingomonas naphthae]WCT75189.1 CoA transferase [Sphingomonas naphthae]
MDHQSLSGRRVVELGTMVAAPFATHILSQLGAEVIKVEPLTGDTTRALVRGGPSGTLIAYSHGKKSVAIDLASPEGAEAFARLIATAHVFIHNLAPGSARKLKVSADDIAALNPAIIYCHVRGYAAGPLAEDLATNPVAEASTGVMDDHRIDGRPSRLGPSYHDQFAGTYSVIRILATMLNPEPTPADRRIEIGLYETGLHLAARDLAGVQLKTQLLGRPEKEAGGEFAMPGYGAYETRDGRWLYLLVLTDAHWARLTRSLAMAEADDPDLAKLRDRKKQRLRVEAAVRAAIGALSYAEAEAKLRAGGVGFNEVMPLERVLDVPQARQPGKLRDLDFRGLRFEVPEFPGAATTDVVPGLPPPELGEHSVEVLESLGYDAAARDAMLASRAVKQAEPGDFAWAPVRQKG